jgi:hypothetical protein
MVGGRKGFSKFLNFLVDLILEELTTEFLKNFMTYIRIQCTDPEIFKEFCSEVLER